MGVRLDLEMSVFYMRMIQLLRVRFRLRGSEERYLSKGLGGYGSCRKRCFLNSENAFLV